MPDLFPFFAVLAALVFGAAAFLLLFAALRIADYRADEAQFLPLPSDDQEPTHAARPFGR